MVSGLPYSRSADLWVMRRLVFLFCACALAEPASGQIHTQPLLSGLEGPTSEPSLSPDGQTLAFGWCPANTCGIYARAFRGGRVRLLIGTDQGDFFPSSPRWSPDGKSIAFTRFYGRYNVKLAVRRIVDGAERELGEVLVPVPGLETALSVLCATRPIHHTRSGCGRAVTPLRRSLKFRALVTHAPQSNELVVDSRR
jgi:hypothetical protein